MLNGCFSTYILINIVQLAGDKPGEANHCFKYLQLYMNLINPYSEL